MISNAYQVIGNWGDGNSGFYTNFSYQSITGDNVASNWRVDGTAGTYWKVYTRSQGSLTVGVNFSAMHYDKNLRYFTIGQGGYFSPQEYFLFNIPIRWNGTWRRQIQYSISTAVSAISISLRMILRISRRCLCCKGRPARITLRPGPAPARKL